VGGAGDVFLLVLLSSIFPLPELSSPLIYFNSSLLSSPTGLPQTFFVFYPLSVAFFCLSFSLIIWWLGMDVNCTLSG
jgi:hypothetical protein